MRLPWRRPKWLGPCWPMCPIEIERRITEAEHQAPLLFVTNQLTQAELDAYKARVVSEMRRIAATLPPPCRSCPANQPHIKTGDPQ